MKRKKNMPFDVIVVGGGLAGLVQTAVLARAGFAVLLVEAQKLPAMQEKNYDLRTTALSAVSQQILDDLGVWPALSVHACAIRDIHIADGDAAGYLHFNAAEVQAEAFGWIVENFNLRAALLNLIQKFPHVEIAAPCTVTDIQNNQADITVILSDGRRATAKLVIAADGRHSFVRQWAGIETRSHDYQTTAVVCQLWHEQDHHHHAIEHFMPHGPLAILPMNKRGKIFQSSLVWSETPARAADLIAMNDTDFNHLLYNHMPHYGKIGVVGARRAYPLGLQHALRYFAPRIALISETVHAMHPIAGQGLNVGMRDVACLAGLLTDARRLGLDIGASQLLQRYGAMRLPDSLAMSAATHGLDKMFSNDYVSLALLRRMGLQMVGKLPPVKKFFMRYAMGLTHRIAA
jgi:2-octaprenyl-6-methoxyphenol hydroxylase